jgi:hypothetical protein
VTPMRRAARAASSSVEFPGLLDTVVRRTAQQRAQRL